MRLLLVLLTVMTFTIESKNSVSMDGLWPYDIGVDYTNSGTKGNVGAGDKATLSLSGLENIQLESITLYMQSNKHSGAGTIIITADGATLYSKNGTYEEWFGAYNNAEFQPIGWSGEKILNQGTLVIDVAGLANSLHIEKYEIHYTNAPERPYTVTFVMDGVRQQISESKAGGGVVLPLCPDVQGWYWDGWSTVPIAEQVDLPPYLLYAGETVYPKKDLTLWAVWTDVMPMSWEKQPKPVSGYYSMEIHDKLLYGGVENGLVPMIVTGKVYENNIYYIDFKPNTTCTIQLVAGQDSYIGYDMQTKKLMDSPSEWRYMMLPDSTWLFIAEQDGEEYWILYERGVEYYEAWLHDYILGPTPNHAWELYELPDPHQNIHWWSYPLSHSVERVNWKDPSGSKEWKIPFGIYDLIIKNGVKELRLKQ